MASQELPLYSPCRIYRTGFVKTMADCMDDMTHPLRNDPTEMIEVAITLPGGLINSFCAAPCIFVDRRLRNEEK